MCEQGPGQGGEVTEAMCRQLSHVTGTGWPCPGTRLLLSEDGEAACLRLFLCVLLLRHRLPRRPATATTEARPQAQSPAPCATRQVTETGTMRASALSADAETRLPGRCL